ncbi:MAG: PEP-CTERM sorting domain-containing protein [Planctomycetota bacterium]
MLHRQLAALALMTAFAFAATAEATIINTIIGNFDIAFDGASGELTDFNRPQGGNLDSTEARTFSSFEVEVGGTTQVMKMNPPDALFGDLLIPNLGAELTTGALISNAGGMGDPDAFGFDYFAPDGDVLRIGIADISYTLVTTGIPGLNFFNWFGNGKVTQQSLDGGAIVYAEDVLISYTATDVMVIQGTSGASRLVASGAMTITGEFIPEPTTAALLLLGAGGLVRRR